MGSTQSQPPIFKAAKHIICMQISQSVLYLGLIFKQEQGSKEAERMGGRETEERNAEWKTSNSNNYLSKEKLLPLVKTGIKEESQ